MYEMSSANAVRQVPIVTVVLIFVFVTDAGLDDCTVGHGEVVGHWRGQVGGLGFVG